MKKVAIIGAGIAGITIAQELNKNFAVTVFEKSRGVGGRMATRRSDGFEFDHGAQFFTANSELFNQFITPLIQKGVIACWHARVAELNNGEVVKKIMWDDSFPHYVGQPSMNAICKYFAANLDIRLNTKIDAIKRENAWRLIDEHDNDHGIYDWIIVTAPAEQTALIMPDSFQFKQEIIKIKMQGCYSLMLGFQKNPLPNFDAALVQNSDISWISVNSSKPGRNQHATLLVNSTNHWAEANMDTDQQIILDYLSQELKKVCGVDVSLARCHILHRWRYANVDSQQKPKTFIDFDQKLAACGDWCTSGKVESAFLAGHTVAQKIYEWALS